MITKKRFLVTLLASVIFTFLFSTSAFAAENDQAATAQTAATEDSNNTENINNASDTEDLAVVSANTEAQDQSITDVTGMQQSADGSYIDEEGQVYVVDYVDEEGRIYYKKAEEQVIEAANEQDESEDDAQEEEKNADDSKAKSKTEKKAATKEKKVSYSENDLRLLACLVYSEAGNQSYKGMLGVANVVLNRTHSKAYYYIHTIKQAIYDKKWSVQFAVTVKNKSGVSPLDKAFKLYDTGKSSGSNSAAEEAAMKKATKAAKAALEGENNIGTYLCFQNVRSARHIKNHYSSYEIIGAHIFYRAE